MTAQKRHSEGLPWDTATEELLRAYGFDAASFSRNRALLAGGAFPRERNRLTRRVEPPAPSDLMRWAPEDSAEAQAHRRLGLEALESGAVAACVLNGGMATRFGGKVKCLVPVTGPRTFLELKLLDVARWSGVHVFIMSSFATHGDTARALDERRHFGLAPERVHHLAQRVSVRLTPEGEIFSEPDGRASLYAPGHGDVFEVLAAAPGFADFARRGGKCVLVSNVDNLGATLDPRVIGAHLASRAPLTVELAAKAPGDQGGAPARVDGRLEIVEGFRFPEAFDQATIPIFNTNTFVIDVSAVRADWPLNWYRADKTVDGAPVVQFERLMGEVTSFVAASYLEIPRTGPEGRFLPVKTPDDLPGVAEIARQRWGVK